MIFTWQCNSTPSSCDLFFHNEVQRTKVKKNTRKSSGSDPLADLIIFLTPGYISINFVFVFIGFVLFSWIWKFTVNASHWIFLSFHENLDQYYISIIFCFSKGYVKDTINSFKLFIFTNVILCSRLPLCIGSFIYFKFKHASSIVY